MATQPITHKFVAVLNKKIPTGNVMNALAHMSAGLSATYPDQAALRFDTYHDKEGGDHPAISDNPFIILRADNSNKLRALRAELIAAGVHYNDFTSSMTVGSYIEQQERTQQTSEPDLEYYGVCMFGEIETLNALTKKFSLWRD